MLIGAEFDISAGGISSRVGAVPLVHTLGLLFLSLAQAAGHHDYHDYD